MQIRHLLMPLEGVMCRKLPLAQQASLLVPVRQDGVVIGVVGLTSDGYATGRGRGHDGNVVLRIQPIVVGHQF